MKHQEGPFPNEAPSGELILLLEHELATWPWKVGTSGLKVQKFEVYIGTYKQLLITILIQIKILFHSDAKSGKS